MPATADIALLAGAHAVLVRHGETTYNATHRLNGDPGIDVSLSEHGQAQCRMLAPLLARVEWRGLFVTRFRRTAQSAALLVPDLRPVVLEDLDDIAVGEFEGRTRDEYRAWRRVWGVDVAPDGGESRLAVAHRYGRAMARLASEEEGPVLVVTHDQPIRYLENALRDADPVVGPAPPVPNAEPFAYSRDELSRGAERLRRYEAPPAERGRRRAS